MRGELEAMKADLERAGERMLTQRAPYEVSEEMKLVSAQLQKLQDLPDDAEKIYKDYTGNLEGLKGKLQELQDNKKLMLKELEERKKAWKNAMQNLIDEVAPIYQQVLVTVGATGAIRLTRGVLWPRRDCSSSSASKAPSRRSSTRTRRAEVRGPSRSSRSCCRSRAG